MNLKNIADKYGISQNDIDMIFYKTFNIVKNSGKDIFVLFEKHLFDRLDALHISAKDIDTLTEYYKTVLEDYLVEKELDEEIQTSANINSAFESRRKAGYKIKYKQEYT